MAEIHWVKSAIAPPDDGDYYTINEVQHDIPDLDTGGVYLHAGDIEITSDWYDTKEGCFLSVGNGNPFWKVVAWAEIPTPQIPEGIRPRVKLYFGTRLEDKNNG